MLGLRYSISSKVDVLVAEKLVLKILISLPLPLERERGYSTVEGTSCWAKIEQQNNLRRFYSLAKRVHIVRFKIVVVSWGNSR